MGIKIKAKNKNGEYELALLSKDIPIIDLAGNFTTKNVEGALRELATSVKDTSRFEASLASINSTITSISTTIGNNVTTLSDHETRITYLEEHGGSGGGGAIVPTITSTFKDSTVDKGTNIRIPIVFSSANLGDGTCYITVNDVEKGTVAVKQGSNTINIGVLDDLVNVISLYVRDRAGLISNVLSFTVTSGGLEITTTFDSTVDWGIAGEIRFDYNISTVSTDTINVTFEIDTDRYYTVATAGYNTYRFSDLGLGVGVHAVRVYATAGSYTSNILTFNLVIVSSDQLYLSSTWVNGTEVEYGKPVSLNYRLSKLGSEIFTVNRYIDDSLHSTVQVPAGNYFWTITGLRDGAHTIRISANSPSGEQVTLELSVQIYYGDYIPVADVTRGLQADFTAVGKSNQDSELSIWNDTSGNGNVAILHDFNFSTNGFVNDELVCDNGAYVEVQMRPWQDNCTNGSTIDLIYTPINSGMEDCRILDYTDADVPYKGIYANITESVMRSAENNGSIVLDDESGEIHLTWIVDRDNKFAKLYINAVLSRVFYLSDEGEGVNKRYENFAHDQYIYLNSLKGENPGTNKIKRLRIYNRALTDEEVLQNHLANITDFEEQQERFNMNYDNVNLPRMYLYGSTDNMTNTQSVNMRIRYVSPNEDIYGSSFDTGLQNNPTYIQGTSSLAYVRKNYQFYLKDENGSDMYWNPFGTGSKAEHIFTIKADKHINI